MKLSDELISQFVKTTRDKTSSIEEVTVYGTVSYQGENPYVQIDGSELFTPISSTTEVNDGERVIVRLKNHTATVVGNISNPSIGTKRAGDIESSITQTAEEIRLEVSNEVAGLESKITQTAEEIRLEVDNEVEGLQSSITQNADSISTLVKNQDEFSEFKQTVEGFAFMGEGGTVLIQDGDINLTGAITFSDLSDEVKNDMESTATIANTAYNNANTASYEAGTAISKAESAQEAADAAWAYASGIDLPDYLHETYIDQTTIMSPTIIGGIFYAVAQDAWTEMSSNGLYVYTGGAVQPKISMDNSNNREIQIVLGAGVSNDSYTRGRLFIWKDSSHAGIYFYSGHDSYNGTMCGFTFRNDGTIVVHGTMKDESDVI